MLQARGCADAASHPTPRRACLRPRRAAGIGLSFSDPARLLTAAGTSTRRRPRPANGARKCGGRGLRWGGAACGESKLVAGYWLLVAGLFLAGFEWLAP